MKPIKILLLILIMPLLASCATPYQKKGPWTWTGGYGNESAPGNLVKVEFFGNGYTSSQQARIYALFRAAQIGRARKKPYFALYQSLLDAAENRKSSMPSFSYLINKPTAYAYVQYHNIKQPGDMSVKAIYQTYQKMVLKHKK